MATLTREILDEILPEGAQLDKAVEHVLLKIFDTGGWDGLYEPLELSNLLKDSAEFIEKIYPRTFIGELPWQKAGTPEYEYDDRNYFITFRGVDYKQRSQYLTLEGWGTGTKCWFVTVEYGWRRHICAETPDLAMRRAVVIIAACFLESQTKPSLRKQHLDYIRGIMKEANNAAGSIQG